jgi:hypothetical protein
MPSGLICRLSSRSGALSSQRLGCYPQHDLLRKSRLAGLDATFTRNSDLIGAHPEARHINGPPKPSSNDSRTSPLALSVRAARTPRTGKCSENSSISLSFAQKLYWRSLFLRTVTHPSSRYGFYHEKCQSVAEGLRNKFRNFFRGMADAPWRQSI